MAKMDVGFIVVFGAGRRKVGLPVVFVKRDGHPKTNKAGTMISGGVVTNCHIHIFERVGFTVKYRSECSIGSLNFP